jgi:hypothetical protein
MVHLSLSVQFRLQIGLHKLPLVMVNLADCIEDVPLCCVGLVSVLYALFVSNNRLGGPLAHADIT